MPTLTTGQVWRQRKGQVRVRVLYFCKANQCFKGDEFSRRVRSHDHVHVVGWHQITMKDTNHSIIKVKDLHERWELA